MNRYIQAFITAILLSLILTPIVLWFAKKIGAVDKPNARKIHNKLIPRLGGLAIYLSFIISIFIYFDYMTEHLIALLLGSFVIVLCGIIDDIRELSYKTKLVFQGIATLILIHSNIVIKNVSIFSLDGASYMELGLISIPVTFLWVIGITNAINLIDGLDGLACGLSSISLLFLFIIFLLTGNFSMALLTLILAGACIGFLPYNFNPAKIFMGDTGSMLLGFILAGVSIEGSVKYATTIILFVPLLIIGLPLYDTLITMLRRFMQGKSITSPDKQHFHHRMLSFGLNQKQVAIVGYIVNIILGCLAILILFVESISNYIVIGIILLLIILFVVENLIFDKEKSKKN